MVDVVIIDSTQKILVSKAAIFKGVVTIVTQVNDGLYCDRHPWDMFLFLAMDIFGCLHHLTNKFLHQCTNMAWSTIDK
jgi:hypothetical protein